MENSIEQLDQSIPYLHQYVRRLVAGKACRVLVGIEDKRTRQWLTAAMRQEGHSVVDVETGYHLVQLLADAILCEDSQRPDLIIAEWRMRGCTGQSLLAGVRDLGWETPVFVLSEASGVTSRRKALQLGATRVFMKPLDLKDIRAATRIVLSPRAYAPSHPDHSRLTLVPAAADSHHSQSGPGHSSHSVSPRFSARRSPAKPRRQCASCGSDEDLKPYGNCDDVAFCAQCSTPISSLGFPEYYCDLGGGG